MALQAGMGVSRLVLIIGTGSVGTALYRNGKLSDVFEELQKLLSAERTDDLKSQIQRITEELKRASQVRPIIINGSGSEINVSSLVLPAAAVGALGYGYMWWKGISFSDLMYVTKRSMATAVENLTKRLEHVSDAIAEAKKHLTQRIENLEGKVDEQVEMSKLLLSNVNDVRGDVSLITGDLGELQRMVSGLGDKLMTMEDKQELANLGVYYLCGVASGQRIKMPEALQEHLKGVGQSVPGLGLINILEIENGLSGLITDGNTREGVEKVKDLKPRVTRRNWQVADEKAYLKS